MLQLSKRGKLPTKTTGAERREYIEDQIKKIGLKAAKEYFTYYNLVHNNITGVFNAEAWASSFNAVYKLHTTKKVKNVKKVKKDSKAAMYKALQKGLVRQMPTELMDALCEELGSVKAIEREMAAELAYERRNMD